MTERLEKWLGRAGLAVAAICAAVAVVEVLTAPVIPARPALSAEERARVGHEFAEVEPRLRQRAAHDFPGHLWGQNDHFHGMEQDWVRARARRLDTNIADIVLAIDEDLRANPPDDVTRFGSVAPCQPLPFYD